ncbi:hypothetical protein [Liquorilactobacillus mali]|uniref:Uncharacterized protein n=1 Tax=Liquorilactobacillus mali KCTC 3596 = DSM 20444 TaxID=1046596 RepID=A0A0R2E397_9LACO|nr:hypothetical protein [Liquorilactobacillus mali]KRN10785.1 hypothetical protein FD00_GL002027 [Liquorilactobacillus mali KCTC 3596 = DSM 20444]
MKKRIAKKKYSVEKKNDYLKFIHELGDIVLTHYFDNPVWRPHDYDNYEKLFRINMYIRQISCTIKPRNFNDVYKIGLFVGRDEQDNITYRLYLDTLDAADFTRYDESLLTIEGVFEPNHLKYDIATIKDYMLLHYLEDKKEILGRSTEDINNFNKIIDNIIEAKKCVGASEVGIKVEKNASPDMELFFYGVSSEEGDKLSDIIYGDNYWKKFSNFYHSVEYTFSYEERRMRKSDQGNYQYIL